MPVPPAGAVFQSPPGTGGPAQQPRPPHLDRAGLASQFGQSDEWKNFTSGLQAGQPINPEALAALGDDRRGFRAYTKENPNWLYNAWSTANPAPAADPNAAPGATPWQMPMPTMGPFTKQTYADRPGLYRELRHDLRRTGFDPRTGALRNPQRMGFSNPLATPAGRDRTAGMLDGTGQRHRFVRAAGG